MSKPPALPILGVVIVTYNAQDDILNCLESLLAARRVSLHIVVIDNASTDDTVHLIQDWASGRVSHTPPEDLPFEGWKRTGPVPCLGAGVVGTEFVLVESGANAGFAAGVNRGLALLASNKNIDRFWILNPDCVVPPQTPALLAEWQEPKEGFSLLGSRIIYWGQSGRIQSDGGKVNWMTGVTGNINLGRLPGEAPKPDPRNMDYISGASMVASRPFYEKAGPMQEGYFLYYEEVDWATRRGALPLAFLPEALVYHRAGTSAGSATVSNLASAFSIYFLYRARLRFIRLHRPLAWPVAYAYAVAKAIQIMLKKHPAKAFSLLRAVNSLPPPPEVHEKLSPETIRLILGIRS